MKGSVLKTEEEGEKRTEVILGSPCWQVHSHQVLALFSTDCSSKTLAVFVVV